MSNLSKAGEDLKFLANKFQALYSVAEVLERIGSLEQAERDALAKKDAAYAKAEEAIKKAERANATLAHAEESVEVAKTLAADHNVRAQAYYSAKVVAAEGKAEAILAEAADKKRGVEEQTKAARAELASVQEKIQFTSKELGSLKEELVKIKASLAAFVRG
jgi:chromosome segregation ATPase